MNGCVRTLMHNLNRVVQPVDSNFSRGVFEIEDSRLPLGNIILILCILLLHFLNEVCRPKAINSTTVILVTQTNTLLQHSSKYWVYSFNPTLHGGGGIWPPLSEMKSAPVHQVLHFEGPDWLTIPIYPYI